MTAASDTAAQAAIGAAARELHLPTVRDQAARLAEIAARDHSGYLAYLAEVLAAELDDRSARRRARRIAEARFPRLKRLADFNTEAVPAITPALLANLATGAYLDKGEPVVLLGDSGNQVACRLHAVLCELVPGGVRKEITASHAARLLQAAGPSGAVETARWQLASDFLEDLRRLDEQMKQTKKKLAAAVKASGTTLTEVFGVGPVVAAIVLGEAGDVARFRDRDRFAACNGTAPIEVSSGRRTVHRLSRRGNRRVNHAIHMAAITQIRYAHSEGRAYYDKKLAEGKTSKEALRALKRRISDALFRRLRADARRTASASAQVTGPGGQAGNVTDASAAGSHPGCRLFGEATPGPEPTLRPAPAAQPEKHSSRASRKRPGTT